MTTRRSTRLLNQAHHVQADIIFTSEIMELIVENYCDLYRADTSLQIIPLLTTCHLLKSLTIPHLYSAITLTKTTQWPKMVGKACPSSFKLIKSFVVGKERSRPRAGAGSKSKVNEKEKENDDNHGMERDLNEDEGSNSAGSSSSSSSASGTGNDPQLKDVDLEDIKNGPLITELRNVRGKKEHQMRVAEAKKAGSGGGGRELGAYKGLVVNADYLEGDVAAWKMSRLASFLNPVHLAAQSVLGLCDIKPAYSISPRLEVVTINGPVERNMEYVRWFGNHFIRKGFSIKEFHFTLSRGDGLHYHLAAAANLKTGFEGVAKLVTTKRISLSFESLPHCFCYPATTIGTGKEDWMKKIDLRGCGGQEGCPLLEVDVNDEEEIDPQPWPTEQVGSIFQPLRHIDGNGGGPADSGMVI